MSTTSPATSERKPKPASLARRFPRSRWPLLVIVVRAEGQRIQPRADLAAWFRENDLEASAVECMRRKVAPGEILVYAEIDTPELAHSGFYAIPVRA